ncbi:transcription factor TGA1-like [Populus alba x Populus x berolinensis]|uniref:Transcription factor TGA1-like n=1 Tax=Populus alba x Populus x berolinensis TaxID=444605 RepID=A0AAD6VWS4_9ROSI|nr:transcription factor TGA1-like [Populus alba x Populus x berolinensis]
MNSTTTQFVTSGRMGIYDPMHQIGMWGENFKSNGNPNTSTMFIAGNPNASASMIIAPDTKLDNQSEDTSQGTLGHSNKYDQEASKPADKVQRRLAQNREAARKSAYVQQLESSRVKLIQLEQELDRARQQGLYIGGGVDASQLGFGGPTNSGIATFEMEYGHWLEEQNRHICDMKTALNTHISDVELRILVERDMSHYFELFRLKATAAKADVFYVMSGLWKSSAERFFLWIGGFRPSELLKILVPCMEPLTEQQLMDVVNLRQSCQQAEDALSQGLEKLQQNVAETVAAGQLGEASYSPHLETAIEKLEAVARFVQQADHIRQETLQQMSRILTTRQAARGLLALGEYLQRLRDLSSRWATPRRPYSWSRSQGDNHHWSHTQKEKGRLTTIQAADIFQAASYSWKVLDINSHSIKRKFVVKSIFSAATVLPSNDISRLSLQMKLCHGILTGTALAQLSCDPIMSMDDNYWK